MYTVLLSGGSKVGLTEDKVFELPRDDCKFNESQEKVIRSLVEGTSAAVRRKI